MSEFADSQCAGCGRSNFQKDVTLNWIPEPICNYCEEENKSFYDELKNG